MDSGRDIDKEEEENRKIEEKYGSKVNEEVEEGSRRRLEREWIAEEK